VNGILLLYALGVWVIFGVLAIINGVIRNSFYAPRIGEYPAHVISTIIGICFVVVGSYMFLRLLQIDYSNVDLLLVGALWLVLTVLFEFVFGHYVVGHPWQKLLAEHEDPYLDAATKRRLKAYLTERGCWSLEHQNPYQQ